ncbi:MAG: haloacid dehalogenase type II [Rhodospirillaceae bacterium]|nr:haloacid dehalogenase type II [Rhodospirillaceae bacterium]MBT3628151.1 haloacid dehalogenase type II [Rhodospirillaceae bacterium]MBT3926708.1 haloacid dehalogenase type II [Rhodospirillaceae bacterium]MBT4428222.1 haloacid dehalogenase type II [Rhodospirillaceae bacterium]MBT5037058.1 haloacid dehalogenase type II [Rhodospirillaceae bacterium]
MSGDAVRALTFDVFGTVVDWRTSIAREGVELGRAKGIDLDWHEFADDWRALYQPAMQRVRSGEIAWCKLDDLHRMNLDELLARHGVDGLTEAELDHLNRAWHRLDPWPDTIAGLTRLKQKFTVATLSNGNVSLLVNMAKRAALPWDAVLGAETAGAYKPQPAAYLKTAEMLGCAPEQCMMVAAHNGDLAAAAALGMRTAFVLRPSEYGPEQTTDLAPQGDWDIVAADFLELADKLDC